MPHRSTEKITRQPISPRKKSRWTSTSCACSPISPTLQSGRSGRIPCTCISSGILTAVQASKGFFPPRTKRNRNSRDLKNSFAGACTCTIHRSNTFPGTTPRPEETTRLALRGSSSKAKNCVIPRKTSAASSIRSGLPSPVTALHCKTVPPNWRLRTNASKSRISG